MSASVQHMDNKKSRTNLRDFWRWGELNPRPKVEAKYIYMFSYAR